MSIDTGAGGTSFAFRDRRVVMDWPYFSGSEGRSYDVAPDGRFLAIEAVDGAGAAAKIYLVTNGLEELRQLTGS